MDQKGHGGNNSDFEKQLEELKQEIREEQQDIRELRQELRDEEADLDKLEEKLEKLEDEHAQHEHHHNGHGNGHSSDKDKVKLIFIVNGKPYEKVVKRERQLLSIVEEVLNETGNSTRPVKDWTVKFKDKDLDITKTVKELNLPNCAELFLSLKAGTGGAA